MLAGHIRVKRYVTYKYCGRLACGEEDKARCVRSRLCCADLWEAAGGGGPVSPLCSLLHSATAARSAGLHYTELLAAAAASPAPRRVQRPPAAPAAPAQLHCDYTRCTTVPPRGLQPPPGSASWYCTAQAWACLTFQRNTSTTHQGHHPPPPTNPSGKASQEVGCAIENCIKYAVDTYAVCSVSL